tara:strand:+ start:2324 stop:3622 length:1299 start_codon:yes stop_codon:yes gene_type:complete
MKYLNTRVLGEITSTSVGYFLTVLGALVGIRIITNFLSPSQYGELSLGITTGCLVYSIFLGPLSNGVSRFLSIARKKRQTSLFLKISFNIFSRINIFLALFSFLIIIFFYILGIKEWINLAIASIGFGFLYGFNNIIITLQSIYRTRGIVSFHQGLMTIMRFLFAIFFIKIFGSSSEAAMYGQFVGLSLVFFSQYYFLKSTLKKEIRNDIDSSPNFNWDLKIIKYTIPLVGLGFVSWLRLAFEKWGLLFFTDYDSAVGFYAIIYQYGYYPISIIVGVLTNYLRPIYFDKAGDDNKKLKLTFRIGIKIFVFSFISLFILVIVIFYNRDFIFKIILNENYFNIAYLIGPMMMTALFNESTFFISLLLQTKKNTKMVFLPNAITHISGILLSILGLYFGGLYGLVFASLINSIFKFLFFTFLCISEYKKIDIYLR